MEVLNTASWYIVYTNLLREKRVIDFCIQKNIDHYCPVKRVRTKYRGLLQTSYEPLFPSYVFIHVAPVELPRIKMIPEVIGLVHWLGQPALIRVEEINAVKKFLNFYNDVQVEKMPVVAGGTIAVMYSPMRHTQTILNGTTSGFVKMQLPSLGYVLKARVSRDLIKWADILQLTNYQQQPVAKFAS